MNRMLEAKLSYKDMDDLEIFYSDYKENETNGVTYGIGVIKVAHPDQVSGMAERMQKVLESEIKNNSDKQLPVFEVYDTDYSPGYMGFAGNDMEFTNTVMDTAFSASGEKQGDFCVFSPSLSRKTDVIPPIDNCLNTLDP